MSEGVGYCFWHGPESWEEAWRVCFECHHVFRSPRQLRLDHLREMWKLSPRIWLYWLLRRDIPSCPYCTHNF